MHAWSCIHINPKIQKLITQFINLQATLRPEIVCFPYWQRIERKLVCETQSLSFNISTVLHASPGHSLAFGTMYVVSITKLKLLYKHDNANSFFSYLGVYQLAMYIPEDCMKIIHVCPWIISISLLKLILVLYRLLQWLAILFNYIIQK